MLPGCKYFSVFIVFSTPPRYDNVIGEINFFSGKKTCFCPILFIPVVLLQTSISFEVISGSDSSMVLCRMGLRPSRSSVQTFLQLDPLLLHGLDLMKKPLQILGLMKNPLPPWDPLYAALHLIFPSDNYKHLHNLNISFYYLTSYISIGVL